MLVGSRAWHRWPMQVSCVDDTPSTSSSWLGGSSTPGSSPSWLGSFVPWGPPSAPSCCATVVVEAKEETRKLQPNAFGKFELVDGLTTEGDRPVYWNRRGGQFLFHRQAESPGSPSGAGRPVCPKPFRSRASTR